MSLAAERYFVAFLGSTGITFGLFWLMTALIHIEGDILPDKPIVTVEIVDVIRDTPVRPIRREPPIQQKPIIEPTPSRLDPDEFLPNDDGIPILSPAPPNDASRDLRKPSLTQADGDAAPLVRVPPDYPSLAMRRGLEGRVLVSFTIRKNGSVGDVRVLAAEPLNVFEAAAIKAVQQWKYEPRIVDGVPVEQRDQRISIPFRLDESSN